VICFIADCHEAATSGPYCAMHRKRLERGTPMHAPKNEKLTPKKRAFEASLALGDADSEDDSDFMRREDNWTKATGTWHRSLSAAKAGKARWKGVRKGHRRAAARAAAKARWERVPADKRAVAARRAARARWKRVHANAHACIPAGQTEGVPPGGEAAHEMDDSQPPRRTTP
jgi:hypothetical protein